MYMTVTMFSRRDVQALQYKSDSYLWRTIKATEVLMSPCLDTYPLEIPEKIITKGFTPRKSETLRWETIETIAGFSKDIHNQLNLSLIKQA